MRSSLDLLDGVIGEFDDGLTSSAESEAAHRRPLVRADTHGSRLSINEQIDDIFSQLTEEIYCEERKEQTVVRATRRSPTRNRFDPLPIPPVSTNTHPPPIDRRKKPAQRSPSSGRGGQEARARGKAGAAGRNSSLPAKYGSGERGEVVVYGDRGAERRTLEKVTAEVHKVRPGAQPPPKPEKQKIHLKHASNERRPVGSGERRRVGSTDRRPVGSADRRPVGSADRRRERSRSGAQREVSRQEQAVIQELRQKVGATQGKISKFDEGNRRRGYVQQSPSHRGRNDDDLTITSRERGWASQEQRSSGGSAASQRSGQGSGQYESLRGSNVSRGGSKAGSSDRRAGSREGYSRSHSMGPLEGRRDSPDRTSVQRTRSRGAALEERRAGGRPASQQRYGEHLERTRSKSRGRREEESAPREAPGRSRSRGRSPPRRRSPTRPSDYERQGRARQPPTPEEAQATIEQMLPRWAGAQAQALTPLPRYPYAIPPERQRSMVDLRATEDFKPTQRRSMAVGPYEDLPPHLRNHLVSFHQMQCKQTDKSCVKK